MSVRCRNYWCLFDPHSILDQLRGVFKVLKAPALVIIPCGTLEHLRARLHPRMKVTSCPNKNLLPAKVSIGVYSSYAAVHRKYTITINWIHLKKRMWILIAEKVHTVLGKES